MSPIPRSHCAAAVAKEDNSLDSAQTPWLKEISSKPGISEGLTIDTVHNSHTQHSPWKVAVGTGGR